MPQYRPLSETKFINDANLVAYYPLNGNSTDIKNANNGTDTDITYGTAYGKFGEGADFDGNSSRLVLPNLGTSGSSARTVSMWVNIANSAAGQLFYSGNETSLTGFRLLSRSAGNGDIQLDFYDRSVTTASGVLPNTTWTHVVAVYLGGTISTTTALIYVNGALIATTVGGGVGGTANTANANYCIGARRNNNDTFVDGSIDDVSIFSRALSSAEVNELYQGMTLGEYLGAGSATTKLLLHLNGNSTDSSGNGNNGTDTAITYSQANGKFGQGAGFNGSSSYIQLGNLASQTQMSIFAWVYCAGTTGAIQCILATAATGANNGFHLQTYDDTQVNNAIYADGAVVTVSLPIAIVSQLSGGWHLYGFTSKTGESKTYLDGIQIGSTVTTAFTNINLATTPSIGRGYNNVRWFNGKIDEVIYENRAWSASEIKKYYTYAKGRFGII